MLAEQVSTLRAQLESCSSSQAPKSVVGHRNPGGEAGRSPSVITWTQYEQQNAKAITVGSASGCSPSGSQPEVIQLSPAVSLPVLSQTQEAKEARTMTIATDLVPRLQTTSPPRRRFGDVVGIVKDQPVVHIATGKGSNPHKCWTPSLLMMETCPIDLQIQLGSLRSTVHCGMRLVIAYLLSVVPRTCWSPFTFAKGERISNHREAFVQSLLGLLFGRDPAAGTFNVHGILPLTSARAYKGLIREPSVDRTPAEGLPMILSDFSAALCV